MRPMTSRTEKLLLLLLFLAAFAIRFNYHRDGFALPPQNPDGYYYHRLAQNILRGRGFAFLWGTGHEYRLFRPPGYPLFLAALYSVMGFSYAGVRLSETAVSAATVIVLFFLTLRLFGRRAAWAAAICATFYWRGVLWAAVFRAETLFMFLFILSLYYLVSRRSGEPRAAAAASGLLLALSCLVRPNIIGILPFFLLLLLLPGGGWPFRRRAAAAAVFAAVFAAGVAPWIMYNSFHRHFSAGESLGTTMGAINVWSAHNPAVGDEVDNRGLEQANLLRYAHPELDERAWIALLQEQTRGFLRSDPVRCLTLSLLRLKKHWLAAGVVDGEGTIYPDTGRNRYGMMYFYNNFWKPGTYFRDDVWVSMEYKKRLAILGVRVPLLTFEGLFNICLFGLLAGLIRSGWRPGRLWSSLWRDSRDIIVIAAGYILFSIVGYSHHRLRYPLEWLALVYAGWGIDAACDLIAPLRRAEKRRDFGPARCALPLLLIAALAAIFSATMRFRMDRTALHMGRICAGPSQEASARAYFSRAAPAFYARLRPEVTWKDVWRYRMAHRGGTGIYRGTVVCWEGEATFIRGLSVEEIGEEPLPYREAWKLAPAGASRPLLIRLVVGSYRDPRSLGDGEVLIICDRSAADAIRDGDRVSVLAEIAGADNSSMGCLIAFARALYQWRPPGGG